MGLEALSLVEWRQALESLPSYPFFAAPRFLASWASHYSPDARPRAWRLREATGAWRLAAVLETRTSRFGTRALIAPEGGYGVTGAGRMQQGWSGRLMQGLRHRGIDSIDLVLAPGEQADAIDGHHVSCAKQDAWIIDLSSGVRGWLEAGLDKRVRRQLRICETAGVRTAREGPAALDEFYEVYAQALHDNPARATYSKAFLADLICSDGPGAVDLYMTRHNGRTIAAGMLLRGGQQAIAWIGCFDRENAHLHGNLHRHYTVISELAQARIAAYNLGAAPGLPDVARFKRKLGAQPQPYSVMRWRNPLLGRIRRLLGRA